MSHGTGSYIIAQYPTSRRARECADELRAFFPKHAAARSRAQENGPPAAQPELGVKLGLGFYQRLTWGKDMFFEAMPYAHSLGCEVMIYHQYCHSFHDFEEELGSYFEATGASISGKGQVPTISASFRLACKIENTDPALPFYQAYKQAASAPDSLADFRAARDALIRLETLFKEKAAFEDNYWRCFGESDGEFPEFITFGLVRFTCNGLTGSLEMPFDGDLPCLETFFNSAAFKISRLAWCETAEAWFEPGKRAKRCALTNLNACPRCNGNDLEFIPKTGKVTQDQVGCLSCKETYSRALLRKL